MEQEALTHKIIGCAYTVFNKLGYGYLESIYPKALLIELQKAGLKAEPEKALKVHYDEIVIGDFSIDVFVEDAVVVELKSVEHLGKGHEVQLVNYLAGLNKDIGLLINFGPSGVDVKRKYRQTKELT